MNTELKEQYQEFKTIVENEFIPILHERIDRQIRFMEQVSSLQQAVAGQSFKIEANTDALKKFHRYKKDLLALVDARFTAPGEINFDVDFLKVNQAADHYLGSVPEEVSPSQQEARFKALPGDPFLLRVGKWWKRLFFALSKWPERISDGFRRLFKKEVKPLKPWTHHVKLRELTAFYLKETLFADVLSLLQDIHLHFITSSRVCWQVDEEIDRAFEVFLHQEDHSFKIDKTQHDRVKEEAALLKGLKDDLPGKVMEIYERVFSTFADAYEKAGTIELSDSRFTQRKVHKKHATLNKHYQQLEVGWENTELALSDDWEIDLELYTIIYAGLEEFYVTMEEVRQRIREIIAKKLDGVRHVLEETREQMQHGDSNAGDFKGILEQQLAGIREKLSQKLLSESTDYILRQDFPELINNFEASLERQLQSISTRRVLVKGITYNEPVKTSALSYISPYELIHFESWPLFQKVIKETKIMISGHVNTAQNDIIDLGQIAEFNLESALSLYESNDETNDPALIAAEGIDRTIEKLDGISKSLMEMGENIQKNVFEGLEKFNNELVQFTNNENIYNIRVRIARGKALQRSRAYKERVIHNIRNFLPTLLVFVKSNYLKAYTFVLSTLKKYGIGGQQREISTELADFLTETEQSIERLPFVYQRLFRSEPLDDVNLFEGRNAELLQLNNSYNNWMKGRFASVVVIGEKGSGVTTLLNFFLKDLTTSSPVFRFVLSEPVETLAELLKYFSEQFGESLQSIEQLVTFLNSRKRVIVLENIQRLYLKRVNGFGALRMFTELISLTSKHVFWVTSATRYAWEYLNKTISLADHFSYHIMLKEFESTTVVNVISKRHRVSGYNIEFEPAPSDLNNRKFKKLSDDEKQAVLRENYFDNLNKIAKSNVSLALIYWLRSTREISGNTIIIGSLKDIDYSFMNNLSSVKVFALVELLLHDGLSEHAFCKVTGYTTARARAILQPMFEDGMIILNNQTYLINPLLYRQTVLMLKAKNIIH